MHEEARAARAGDVCVLLEPVGEDVVDLRHLQRKLQERFGGRIHRPVHLTCQRFRLGHRHSVDDVIQSVMKELTGVDPFPVLADSLALMEHQFWQSRLLRWRVQSTLELRSFSSRLERVLSSEAIRPHFPSERGWLPRYVTALEGVLEKEVGAAEDALPLPYRLFCARRLVFSVIEEGKSFRIIGETRLFQE